MNNSVNKRIIKGLSPDFKSLLQIMIRDLERKGRFDEEKSAIQHGNTTIYSHSLKVAYTSLWLMEKSRIPMDVKSLAKGALLHDYFLYDWHDADPSHRLHGFTHPKKALKNAQRDYNLNWKEKNIISRHMFPLVPVPPQCREAWLVCMVDKWCALSETIKPMFHVKHFKR